MERPFFVLGGVGFILCFLAVFYIFGNVSIPNILTSQNVKHIQNFSLEGQFVAMMFWAVLSLTGGLLWVSTLFRIRSIIEASIISLTLGALVISLSVVLISPDVFFQMGKTYPDSGMLTESTLLILIVFVFVGFLSRIFREIISSRTSSLGIRKK